MTTESDNIQFDIEESNELLFKIRIEGTDPAPAKVRLVLESNDMSFMFKGTPLGEDDLVQFIVPSMMNKMKEGTYTGKVEVLVENRYFTPVQFDVDVKKTMKVVAESVQVIKRQMPQAITVSAAQIVQQKPVVEQQQAVVRQVPAVPQPRPAKVSPPIEVPQKKQPPPVRQPASPITPTKRPISYTEKKLEEMSKNQVSDDATVREIAKTLVNELFSKRK